MLTTALLLAVAVPASAQFSKPEDAIRYRQSAYVIMGHNMGKIFAQLKSDKPDVAAIQRSAAIVDFVSQLPGEGYVKGSEKGGTPPTKAKPEVFTDPKVSEVGRAMRQEVTKLVEVSKGGDIGAIRTQFQATVKSCDNCHDNYRNK
ncbi:MAG TPA: cytochrome c [Burkholderiaceae bacterium]|nr:cytochrome c [Burkholderiaceae bacterium]